MLIIRPAAVKAANEVCILVDNNTNSLPRPCSLMPPICSLTIHCAGELWQ